MKIVLRNKNVKWVYFGIVWFVVAVMMYEQIHFIGGFNGVVNFVLLFILAQGHYKGNVGDFDEKN